MVVHRSSTISLAPRRLSWCAHPLRHRALPSLGRLQLLGGLFEQLDPIVEPKQYNNDMVNYMVELNDMVNLLNTIALVELNDRVNDMVIMVKYEL